MLDPGHNDEECSLVKRPMSEGEDAGRVLYEHGVELGVAELKTQRRDGSASRDPGRTQHPLAQHCEQRMQLVRTAHRARVQCPLSLGQHKWV
jgi:hypothetical protein